MKPRSFDYVRPKSLAEALALLQRHGPDAKIIAGGQSLEIATPDEARNILQLKGGDKVAF